MNIQQLLGAGARGGRGMGASLGDQAVADTAETIHISSLALLKMLKVSDSAQQPLHYVACACIRTFGCGAAYVRRIALQRTRQRLFSCHITSLLSCFHGCLTLSTLHGCVDSCAYM